jgi:hypothetical protein
VDKLSTSTYDLSVLRRDGALGQADVEIGEESPLSVTKGAQNTGGSSELDIEIHRFSEP